MTNFELGWMDAGAGLPRRAPWWMSPISCDAWYRGYDAHACREGQRKTQKVMVSIGPDGPVYVDVEVMG